MLLRRWRSGDALRITHASSPPSLARRQAPCGAITFDIDADSLIRNARPEDGHLRLAPVSMGRYGPTVAVPRILDTYRRFGLTQTFFMPGWVMETYPATVEMILKDGHEIGHHSWRHEDPMGHSDEREAELFTARSKRMCG
jgi:peptidoglycan-N-acetylglucosamine deacetylase